jgi:hypothetical protein
MGYADAGGVHRVVQRLEARAARDAALAKKREDHRRTLSDVTPRRVPERASFRTLLRTTARMARSRSLFGPIGGMLL